MSKPTISRKKGRLGERRAHTRTPGVVTALREQDAAEVPPAPAPEIEESPAVGPTEGDAETPAEPTKKAPAKSNAAPRAPRRKPAPEPEAAPEPKAAAEQGSAPSRAQKAHPRMTLTISAEVEEQVQELVYDELEATGKMPTLWQFYDRALAEFFPTVAEAQEHAAAGEDMAVEDGIPVYTNVPASTRRLLSKARNARTRDNEKIRLSWFYTEAVRRFVAARQQELAAQH